MSKTVQSLLAMAIAFALAYWMGRWSKPGEEETPAELVGARIASDSAQLARIADSLAVARAWARTDSAIAAARRAERRAAAAAAVSRAYQDTVRLLGDSQLVVTHAGGTVDTTAIAAEAARRMRADSATMVAQRVTIDSLKRAELLAKFERDTSWRAIASAANEAAKLRTQIPLEIKAAYARGKRVGRQQGMVIGSIGTLTVVFTGVKVVQAPRE